MMIFDTSTFFKKRSRSCWESLAEVEIHNLGCSHEDFTVRLALLLVVKLVI